MATRGWNDVTMADVTKRELARQRAHVPAKRRSKYGAVKTTVDGIVFDSAKEARRYGELCALQSAREIHELRTQVPFELWVATSPTHRITLGKYIADFVYRERDGQDWLMRIEDVKGFKTPLYRWKKKHFEAQYGITIKEV